MTGRSEGFTLRDSKSEGVPNWMENGSDLVRFHWPTFSGSVSSGSLTSAPAKSTRPGPREKEVNASKLERIVVSKLWKLGRCSSKGLYPVGSQYPGIVVPSIPCQVTSAGVWELGTPRENQ